ncbi:MAG: T9SS type A sorting domain-containing protein [candidate division Zixibacteria bacterium]|nr:T9SS type A sorting domain-containing protein [candidate division Zixibacteria bacterium]
MYRFVLCVGWFLMVCNAFGDATFAQDTLWTRLYGGSHREKSNDLLVTEDTEYILIGNIDNVGGQLIKADSLGDTIWTTIIEGSAEQAVFSQADDLGYMVVGTKNSDLRMALVSDTGTLLWSKTYGGYNSDYGRAIASTNDGGYILAGDTRSFGAGNLDWYVVKIDSDGDTIWTHTYGWSNSEYLYSIQQTTDGGYIIAGYSYFNDMGRAYLLKINAQGEPEWYNLEWDGYDKLFSSVKQTSDGGYIAVGRNYNYDWDYYYRLYMVKYDSLGSKEWWRQYGNANDFSSAFDVNQTIDGGYIMVGSTRDTYSGSPSEAYIIRADWQGNEIWTRIYGSPGYNFLKAIESIGNNEYVASGGFDEDMWLVKLQEPLYCCVVDMIPDDDPVIVQPGSSFGYTGRLINLTSIDLVNDVWVGVIYEDQFFQTRLFEGTEPLEPGEFLTRHFRQNVPNYAPIGDYRYIAYGGNYPSKCDSVWFEFTVEGAPLADGNREWSVMETTIGAGAPTGGEETGLPSKLKLDGSPNPFNANTRIDFMLSESGHTKVEVYDLMGRKVEVLVDEYKDAGSHTVVWDAEDYPSGIYFCKLTQGSLKVTKKMGLVK